MAKIIAICGPTCSGKTTLAKFLTKYGYNRIVTYTTRPKRGGEFDGADYHFISEEEFMRLDGEGFFAETASYDASFGKCYYGSAAADYETGEKRVTVLNARGIKSLCEKGFGSRLFIVRLEPTYAAIFSRGYARGDTTQELNRRVEGDEKDCKLIKDGGYIDYLVEGDWPVEVVAQWVLSAYNGTSA